MADPKLNALVFCVKAVWAEPWWNFVGAFVEVVGALSRPQRFDVYLKLGDVTPGADHIGRLAIVAPASNEVLAEQQLVVRASANGVAERVFEFEVEFLSEGNYIVEA